MLEINPLITKRLNAKPNEEIGIKSPKFVLPRTSQQRLKDALGQPPIKRMFGDIWLTGELHLLFADTGVGKSILAVTIGDALSKGKKVMFLENECEPLTVLYYDFERA
jgi:RecA-family ATPase